MKGWTEKRVKELYQKGKIRGYKIHKKEHKDPAVRKIKKRSKEKDWISWNLSLWCNEHALTLEEEYRFHPERKFRIDWFIPALSIGIEYEGIFSEKSRHTNKVGYSKDTEKYNLAANNGITILRYTAMNFKQLLRDLDEIYHA